MLQTDPARMKTSRLSNDDTPVHPYPEEDEDQVHLLYGTLDERFSREVGSQNFLPRELLIRWRLDYKKHCCVMPGTYCEVHDEPVPTNTMVARTHKAIALGPTGNLQGSVKFYCIHTGWVLKRRLFMPMPKPDLVIQRVNRIREREKQLGCLLLQESSGFLCFLFLWHFFHRNHDSCSAVTFVLPPQKSCLYGANVGCYSFI